MDLYSITYDLSKPNRDYESLSSAIKNYGRWWHQSGSVWIIAVNNTNVVQIRDYLLQFIDNNDKIFVAKLSGHWAGFGFTEKEYDWMNNQN